MKTIYTFTDGDHVEADSTELANLLALNKEYLQNYFEVFDSLDDDSFVARGNGFCDRKYSDDFIEGQIAKYQQRIADIEKWIAESNQ